jgi:hypothetical protein|tara:strand:- start:335 stop:463 length:129 start_codon:yes stop_codon:yes gene_type:complete
VKLIKGIWDKIVNVIDDIIAQLGLHPKPIPVRVKKNSGKKKK